MKKDNTIIIINNKTVIQNISIKDNRNIFSLDKLFKMISNLINIIGIVKNYIFLSI